MPKKARLLQEHLEDVSWRVMEEYKEVIRELIRARPGVYALYRNHKLYYVGLASNLNGRIKSHLRDRHNGKWDRFSVYLTSNGDHIKELESLVLCIVNPAGNKQKGKFSGSVNLGRELNRRMRETDADRRAVLLGGQVARRRRRIKTRGKKGTKALAGAVERRVPLRGERGAWEYRAALLRTGMISYGGKKYDSPSAAASAAVGRPCNGWSFWRYRNPRGEWVQLRYLKR